MIYEDYIRIKKKYAKSQREYESALDSDMDVLKSKKAMQEWEWLLSKIREELADSLEIDDRVYYLRFVKKKKIKEIARVISYSEAQIYRILANIRKAGT
nr:MAG TPA: ECF sigma factor [Caudoviricetes sp.]